MSTATRGLLIENQIIAMLGQKMSLEKNPQYDHEFKIDFVVHKFLGISRLHQVGVQLTSRLGDFQKQYEFLTNPNREALVAKSIYIEVDPLANLDHYACELIYSALVAFTYSRELKDKKIIGCRINSDITYEFFELADTAMNSMSEFKTGRLYWYNPDRLYGFIEDEANKDWFFHINDVMDTALRTKFLPMAEIDKLGQKLKRPIHVLFKPADLSKAGDNSGGGYDANSHALPATNIRLSPSLVR